MPADPKTLDLDAMERTAADILALIAQGWEVIESDGSTMTIKSPPDLEAETEEIVVNTNALIAQARAAEGLAAERDEAERRRVQLRHHLLDTGRALGCHLSGDVSDEFLRHLPDEARAVRAQRDAAQAEVKALREALAEIAVHPEPRADEGGHWRAETARAALSATDAKGEGEGDDLI